MKKFEKFVITLVEEGIKPEKKGEKTLPAKLHMVNEQGRKITMIQWLTAHLYNNVEAYAYVSVWEQECVNYKRGTVIEVDVNAIEWYVHKKQNVAVKEHKYTPQHFRKCDQTFNFTPEAQTQLNFCKSLDIMTQFGLDVPKNFKPVKIDTSAWRHSSDKVEVNFESAKGEDIKTSTPDSKEQDSSKNDIEKALEILRAAVQNDLTKEDMIVVNQIKCVLATAKVAPEIAKPATPVTPASETKAEATEPSVSKSVGDFIEKAEEEGDINSILMSMAAKVDTVPQKLWDEDVDNLDEDEAMDSADLLFQDCDVLGEEPEEAEEIKVELTREDLVLQLNSALLNDASNFELHRELLEAIHTFQG